MHKETMFCYIAYVWRLEEARVIRQLKDGTIAAHYPMFMVVVVVVVVVVFVTFFAELLVPVFRFFNYYPFISTEMVITERLPCASVLFRATFIN